jgi:hypothetical protein
VVAVSLLLFEVNSLSATPVYHRRANFTFAAWPKYFP